MPKKLDLSLIPTDDLVWALLQRFDNMIFVGEAPDAPAQDRYHAEWKGHGTYCAGLCMELLRDIQDAEREPPDENVCAGCGEPLVPEPS